MPHRKTLVQREFTAWVLRANLSGWVAGTRLLLKDVPRFGDLIQVPVHEAYRIYGLIYDVTIQDDPVVRQLILADVLEPEVILDQRENRLMPIELKVLTIGYWDEGEIVHGLPPQPPINLDLILVCDTAELRAFTEKLTYLHLILNAAQVPADELLVVMLRRAAEVRPSEVRYRFLVEAGRELARLLNSDLARLEGILKRIKPN